jgi:8-oxo-dGTP pyrophosphatase MutT (NUDIX family)
LFILGGIAVFAGGRVERSDSEFSPDLVATPADPRSAQFGASEQQAKACLAAAARECLEEAAVAPVIGAGGSHGKLHEIQDELA